MAPSDIGPLIDDLRRLGGESLNIEVKSARGGFPERPTREAMSAFANAVGGVILFGIDEDADYAVVGVRDAAALQRDLSNLANRFQPPLRPETHVVRIGDQHVVAMEIDELPLAQKPAFFEPAGIHHGAFVRVGPTNRRLSEYEIWSYLAGRSQARFDIEAMIEATLADLDRRSTDAYLASRSTTRRAPMDDQAWAQRLEEARIVREVDGAHHPTLCGLLMFGRYPQHLQPQLSITFVQYFGVDDSEPAPGGARFLDNQRFDGPLPELIDQAVAHVLGRLRTSSLIEGVFRRDISVSTSTRIVSKFKVPAVCTEA